jgi:hypothetical protein
MPVGEPEPAEGSREIECASRIGHLEPVERCPEVVMVELETFHRVRLGREPPRMCVLGKRDEVAGVATSYLVR